jgi:hypothetical protein
MVAQLPWVTLNHLTAKRINAAVHRFGTAASWPISEPSVPRQRLPIVQASDPAEDRARRGEQARGNLCQRVAFMEPQ